MEDLTYWNNKGQDDGARQRDRQDADWLLTAIQDLTSGPDYDPPDDPDAREAYTEGFRNAYNQ